LEPAEAKAVLEPSMQESRHILRPGVVKLVSFQPHMPEIRTSLDTMR
jgi:hypothetical protein